MAPYSTQSTYITTDVPLPYKKNKTSNIRVTLCTAFQFLLQGGEGEPGESMGCWVEWVQLQNREVRVRGRKRLQVSQGFGFINDVIHLPWPVGQQWWYSFTWLGIRYIICPAFPPLLWPVPWFGSLGCVREAVQSGLDNIETENLTWDSLIWAKFYV